MKIIGKIILWAFAILGGLSFLFIAAVAAFTASQRDKAPPMPDSAVLSLDWNEPLEERYVTAPLFKPVQPATVLDTLTALERAAAAPQVKALVVQLGAEPMEFARAQELADAVRAFRESGKPAFAYADDLAAFGDATPEVMLAAAFDKVWMAPSGIVGLTGVALEVPYFAEGLGDLGVTAEFEQRHEFKGGADPFTEERMPLPVRRSLGALAQGLLDQAVAAIAAGRDLEPAGVRALVDQGPLLGDEAVAAGLIDGLLYRDQFESEVEKEFGDDAQWIDAPFLLAASKEDREGMTEPAAKVAVLYGIGPIGVGNADGPFADPGFDTETLIDTLQGIVEDGGYDAVLLRIDSPGGAYGPSDAVWHTVGRVREAGIPVVVSMGGTAASGGYFVSVASDRIVAQPGTITGSVGVYGGKFDVSRLWEDLGVRWDRVAAGENAGMWSINRGFDREERARFARAIDFVYADFTTKVAQGRGFDAATLDQVARGRIFTGQDALDVGLVDRLGGYPAALAELRDLMQIAPEDEIELEVLPKPKAPWQALLDAAQSGDFTLGAATLVADAVEGRIVTRLESALGDLDRIAAPQGLVSAPPVRLAR
ncbi:MAG: signal peptide peptidase SppA [Alphaproteobacteria bacterium]|nr:signal peptide peptidase SppA [Alphaproteobacteria bacterium]MBO6863187.1 signal peptide peptidase SppA [Alphaproteobacteria bacterium]